MAEPVETPSLSAEQVKNLNSKLSMMRHNINNHLALIVAASELIRRKPEMAPRLIENIAQQPDRIVAEVKAFSEIFDEMIGRKAVTIPPTPPASEGPPPTA